MTEQTGGSGTLADEPRTQHTTVLRCRVSGHRFALPLADVVEVHRAAAVTPLPGAPETIRGVVDVRGQLLPLLDLGARLGLPVRRLTPADAFVTVEIHDRPLLLLVDAVDGVEVLPRDRFTDAEALAPGARYLRQVASAPGGPLVVHDLAAFLSTEDLTQLDRALRERESSTSGRGR